MEIIMQAKSLQPRHLGRSVKPVAFPALTMAMALISALLIDYSLVKAAESDPLSSVGSVQAQSVFVLAHEDGVIDHSSLANPAAAKDPAPGE